MRYRLLIGALAVSLGAAACGSSSSTSWTVLRKPQPAGPHPSPIALEVCDHMAQKEIAQDLGVTAAVRDRAWIDDKYSCNYVYPDGSFQLSIKELSSWSQTYSYFDGLGEQLGNTGSIGNLGQGAFRTSNGDIVVRKDWKVLLVNIAGLPSQFGVPATSAPDVAYTIADIILACWAGD